MKEIEKTMALMTKNSQNLAPETVPKVPELHPQPPGLHQRCMPNITLTNPIKNFCGDWGHQLRWEKREGRIMIMFQNMGRMGNKLDQPIQHKLYTLKNEMSNEGISIIGISKVNSNWSKAPIKENI